MPCYEWIKYNSLKNLTLSCQREENLSKKNKLYIAIPAGEWFDYYSFTLLFSNLPHSELG